MAKRTNKEKHYTGKACGVCKGTLRYSANYACVACARTKGKTRTYAAQAQTREANRKALGWAPGEHDKCEFARALVTNCGICGGDSPRHKAGWMADHDHKTGLFRGYLCSPCNLRLGFAEKHGIPQSKLERAYIRAHLRLIKDSAAKVVASAEELAREASPRQRKLSGLRGGKRLPSEQWRFELDAQYRRDLEENPEAALWLSTFNEEICTANVYTEGEPHIHSPEQMREVFKSNQAARRNKDVLSYRRGPSLDAMEEGPGGRDWLFDQMGARPGDVEDDLIDSIDRKRAVALRFPMPEGDA